MATSVTIAPTTGHTPSLLQGGVGVTPGYDAIDVRRLLSGGFREGVLNTLAWKVTESAVPALTVLVDSNVAGAVVQGDSVTDQGLYYVAPHSADVTLDVAAAHATLPRVDMVVIEIKDNAHDGSGSNLAQLRYILGTATSGATLDNRSGAPSVPVSAQRIAEVLVPALDTAITNSQIRDYRGHGYRDANVGDLRPHAGGTAPAGWLIPTGQAVNRVQYADLFAVLGTTYGAGDGSTTFTLPDLRGRVPVGEDAAGVRIATATGRDRGETGGSETVTLSTAQLPSHTHPLTQPVASRSGGGAWGAWSGGSTAQTGSTGVPTTSGNVTEQSVTGSNGSGSSHDNMPPYQVVNWLIFSGLVA